MIKLNEADGTSDLGECERKTEREDTGEETKALVPFQSSSGSAEAHPESAENAQEDQVTDLWFKVNFNNFNCDLDVSRNAKSEECKRDVKRVMYFNKEVSIRSDSSWVKNTEAKKPLNPDKDFKQNPLTRATSHYKSRCCSHKPSESEFGKPQLSEPRMMFSCSLSSPAPEVFASARIREAENLKKFLAKRNPRIENNSLMVVSVHPVTGTDLRVYNSMTSLPRHNKLGLKGVLKSKIPSLTAIEVSQVPSGSGASRFGYWDHWDDLMLMQSDADRRLNLQISRSCNDNSRRLPLKFKKEDPASVSDSKLLFADSESKKQIKKCDKKSRGDSSRKERDARSRKQVQWKTEVDVIYFSTHLAANGDRSGEVIGRVMEPLREEWQQQRKGFYAKTAPYNLESHLKDRFISLLKI